MGVDLWTEDLNVLIQELGTTTIGLTSEEAKDRLAKYGPNRLKPKKRTDALSILASQFKSPIILILLFSSILAFATSDNIDGLIIAGILVLSSSLGFWQEKTTTDAVEKLLEMIKIRVAVLRDQGEIEVPLEQIVPGDIVILNAGDIIPGDCRILDSKDFYVNEAALTGETFPAEKKQQSQELKESDLRQNALFMGTSVVSGTGKAVVVLTGLQTQLGEISERLRVKPPVTEFERGITRFGYLLMELTLIFIVAIFALNVYSNRPVFDSLMFALALAVGITPQLLPAVISINLAKGAQQMANEKVIVKRLNSIEDFGSMNLLCSDKTGTVTEGRVVVHSSVDIEGNPNDQVRFYAYLNAYYQSGYTNPIDEAIIKSSNFDVHNYSKSDELPFDFVRKKLSILIAEDGVNILITKGAVQNVLDVCSQVQINSNVTMSVEEAKSRILAKLADFSSQGYRTIGVAYRNVGLVETIDRSFESDMTFLGFIVLYDPPKPGIDRVIANLQDRMIQFKMITGDNKLVATNLATQIGIAQPKIITGTQLRQMSDEALMVQAGQTDIFAEVEPNQKERVILSLRKSGYVVGFMGDGINDASAIHAADVGISVEGAVDVAKQAAEIVLLEKNLDVLIKGVDSGRKTFANTMKYIFVTTSANFGNMFSMAFASLILPFLPLLPKQILTINLLTDFPATTISTDDVDEELIDKPRRWNIRFITQFMATFGLQSTLFDLLTFAVFLLLLHSTETLFQTGWFVLSVITELLIMLVIRTRRLFWKSRPSKRLFGSSIAVLLIVLFLPYSPAALILSFTPLSLFVIGILLAIAILYVISTELVKWVFYRYAEF
nr:MAG: magnesium-translocating P-type ATPase [Candidatus Thorarchaeota archaeon SMTZ1-45]